MVTRIFFCLWAKEFVLESKVPQPVPIDAFYGGRTEAALKRQL